MSEDIDALVAQIKTLADVVGELRDELRTGRQRPLRAVRPAVVERAMITASRCDALYGLANGTAAQAYRARLVRGREVAGKGRTGRVVKISAADAEAAWGGQLAARVG